MEYTPIHEDGASSRYTEPGFLPPVIDADQGAYNASRLMMAGLSNSSSSITAAAGAAAAALSGSGSRMLSADDDVRQHQGRRQLFSLPVVGEVPSGLPSFVLPPFSFDLFWKMIQPAIVVGIFSFILSMSIVRTFALKYEYSTDSNQELLALGMANIAGAFFLSYPIAGSLSRSALVAQSAQRECTPLHGLFTALLVLLVLVLLTPTFRPMPRACLASIVFMAVKSLFDLNKAKFLYKIKTSKPASLLFSHALPTLISDTPLATLLLCDSRLCRVVQRLHRHPPTRRAVGHRHRRAHLDGPNRTTHSPAKQRRVRPIAAHKHLQRFDALS